MVRSLALVAQQDEQRTSTPRGCGFDSRRGLDGAVTQLAACLSYKEDVGGSRPSGPTRIVAQRAERPPDKREVGGSNPPGPTMCRVSATTPRRFCACRSTELAARGRRYSGDVRRSGREAEGTRLESGRSERVRGFDSLLLRHGEVAERPKAPVWRTGAPQGAGGSIPSLSAKEAWPSG